MKFAPPSTEDGKRIKVGDRLITTCGAFANRVMKVIEVDAHCGNSSDIVITPESNPGVNEDRIRVHGSFFRKVSKRSRSGIPHELWLVLWRRRGGGRIEREVFVSRGGAKRAIRKLAASKLWDWMQNAPIPYVYGRAAAQLPRAGEETK